MQLKRNIAILALAALVFTSPAWGQSASTLLQEGIFIEETVGDLDAAIEIYQKIAASAEKNRTYAALAQYRLGMCYLKKGQKQDAAVAFRKLIDRFPMQTERVAQARVQLSALGQPSSAMATRQVWAPALDTLGGVSPDGRYLSYVHWDTGNLALRDLTTGENRHLTNKGSWVDSNEFAEASRVSPDGTQVAYAWFNEEFYDLRIIGVDGSEPRVLYANDEVAYLQPFAWSPDGKHILVLLSKKNRTNQIVLVSSANGSVRILKTLDWRYPLNMSLSPDGRYVAYDFPPEENSSRRDIFLLAVDGSREIPLIEHAGDDLLPVWAPDGNRIIFGSDRTGAMALWALQVVDGKPQGSPELIKKDMGRFNPIGFTRDGSLYYGVQSGMPDVYTARFNLGTGKFLAPATKVSQRFVGTNFAPDFSSDGKYLLYLSQRGRSAFGVGSRVLVIRSLESGKERILSPTLPFHRVHSVPRWSPDGRSILVTSRDLKGGQGGYRIDAQTSEVTSLVQRTPSMGGKIRLAVWSADGKAILFQRGASLVVRELDSGQEKVLYSCDHIHAWALSADGRQLALTVPSEDQANNSTPANSNVLLVMPATGGRTRELFRVPAKEEITAVVWTPDGRELLFCKVSGPLNMEEELWRIPADGGKPRALALDLTSKQLALLRFHPDGTRIAFTAGDYEEEIWVMENFLPEPKVNVAAASGTVTRQVWAPALDMMGTPSPDGRYLTYVHWDNKGNLAVHDLETGENRDLTDEGTWETPSKFCDVSIWSPDGRQIAYYWINKGKSGSSLRIVGLDGSEPRVLASRNSEQGHDAPWPRAWSQDGKYILAMQGRKDKSLVGHEDHIVLVAVADGSVRVLKSLGERHTKNMSISPDGSYVVYELEERHGSNKRDIHLLATDGSGEVPLVEHPADDKSPFWTPDGKRIVFLSDRSGSMGVWMLDVDDGKPKGTPTQIKETGEKFYPMGFTRDGSFYYGVLTPASDVYVATLDFEAGKVLTPPIKMSLRFEGSNYAPSWSPDGKHMTYASQRSSGTVLVVRSVATGEERDLSPKTMHVLWLRGWAVPRWSPDGSSILVNGRDSNNSNGLYLVDADTGKVSEITSVRQQKKGGDDAWLSWPDFSKDGKQIYYVHDRSIISHDLETQRERELYRANGYIYRLTCSPDGRQLAFLEAAEALRPTVVKLMPASGGKPRVLFTLQEGHRFSWGVGLSWTPDGRHVVVGGPDAGDKPDELWRIPVGGGEPRTLNLGVKVSHLTLHPDGRRIAFASLEPGGGQEVWVMENFLPVENSVSDN